MAYVGYDYGLGSGTAANPNPFVYNGSGAVGYGYDAPFNPQLDHLAAGAAATETRSPEWRVTTTSTTSLTSPWPMGSRTLPAMNWPSQAIGVGQQIAPVHHSSLMLPLSSSSGLLQHTQPQLQSSLLQQQAVQQLHGCNSSHVSPLHISLPHIPSHQIPTSHHHNALSIDVGRPGSGSSSLPERRMRKAKIEPATSPMRPFACNICGKSFSQAANLTAHRRVHTGEKPFMCPVCDRPFSQSSSLVTHKRTHSGERPYQCGQCEKSFTDSSTLTKHLRTHSGHKPYSCNMCMMRFTQSGNLHRHMKTHKNG